MKSFRNELRLPEIPLATATPAEVQRMLRTILTSVVLTAALGIALSNDSSAAPQVPTRAVQSQSAPIDGRNPQAPLIGDTSGTLYGTSTYGGDVRCFHGCGT